ncbi:MAG: DNA alkylation repair protein [Raoultibacter sp.]|jgi:hypothetical protein
MDSQVEHIMQELESLGTERTKKSYLSRGVREPLFGVATGAMKSLLKETGLHQDLSDLLYETGNFDAMYFAGMIAEPEKMTAADFNRWMDGAYTELIASGIVAVTLAESPLAQEIAATWIEDERALFEVAGWSCYEWLLGYLPDEKIDKAKISELLNKISDAIHIEPDNVKLAMINFVIAVGVSYLPLHNEALITANIIEGQTVDKKGKQIKAPSALSAINNAIEKKSTWLQASCSSLLAPCFYLGKMFRARVACFVLVDFFNQNQL